MFEAVENIIFWHLLYSPLVRMFSFLKASPISYDNKSTGLYFIMNFFSLPQLHYHLCLALRVDSADSDTKIETIRERKCVSESVLAYMRGWVLFK